MAEFGSSPRLGQGQERDRKRLATISGGPPGTPTLTMALRPPLPWGLARVPRLTQDPGPGLGRGGQSRAEVGIDCGPGRGQELRRV